MSINLLFYKLMFFVFFLQVPFNAVVLHVLHCDVTPTHILYAVNASLVGLCRIPGGVKTHADGPVLLSQSPICDCFGVGKC